MPLRTSNISYLRGHKTMRAIVPLSVLLVLAAHVLRGEDTIDPFVHYPAPLHPFEYRSAIGLDLTVLPRLVVEEEVRQIPMLDYRARFGLPWNFSLHAYAGTNVITTIGSLGGGWNVAVGPLACGAHIDLAYWYGFAAFEGFDVTASSWLLRPSASIGVEFERVRLTTGVAMQVVTARTTRSDGLDISSDRNRLAGFSIAATVEQPFFGSTHAIMGLTLHRSQAMYQAWLAFQSFDQYLLYPEFTFGVIY